MTGRSNWFDAAVYLAACVACLIAAVFVSWPGVLVGAVFFVLAVRSAWSSP